MRTTSILRAWTLAAMTVAAATIDAAAQDLEAFCAGLYAEPEVGEYSELRLTDSESDRTGTLRVAVVRTEDRPSAPHYWFEITMTGGIVGPEAVIAQILVARYPFDSEDIQGYILKLPGRRAMRVPKEMLNQLSQLTEQTRIGWRDECRASKDLGTEEVRVPAGTFRARHLRTAGQQEGELWLSPDVPFGIVKFTDSRGGRMQLLRHGTGARSSITEEPIDIQVNGAAPPK